MANIVNTNEFMECEEKTLDYPKKSYGFGIRHVQVGILFLCMVCGYAVGSCLNIAILAMTDKKIHGDRIPTFDWDSTTKGIILSASMWGDIPFQIGGSLIVQKLGAKKILSFVMLITGILSIAMPYCSIKLGWVGISVLRLFQGLVRTLLFPCTHTLIGKWVPILERNRFGNFVYSGVYVSIVTTMPLTALIANSFLGWPWVFYIFGGVSSFCGLLWIIYGAESPAHHSTISAEEKKFIQSSLGNEDILRMKLKTPWRAMMTSAPVWALVIIQTGACWGFTVMYMETPTFLKKALGIDLQNSGFFTALPYATAWFVIQAASVIADYLVSKGYFTLTGVRKLMNTIGTFGPASFLFIIPFIPTSNVWLSVTFVVLIVSADGINAVGFLLNHIDLSPNFAGVLVSFANTATSAVCFLAPIISGYVLQDPTDIEQWKIIFFIAAAFYVFGNCAFFLYGSGDVQSFNNSYTLKDCKDTEKSELQNQLIMESTKKCSMKTQENDICDLNLSK